MSFPSCLQTLTFLKDTEHIRSPLPWLRLQPLPALWACLTLGDATIWVPICVPLRLEPYSVLFWYSHAVVDGWVGSFTPRIDGWMTAKVRPDFKIAYLSLMDVHLQGTLPGTPGSL